MASNRPTPAVLSRGYGLRVIDYSDSELSGQADATGTCALYTDYLPQERLMRVERITVTGDSANYCTITVMVGDDPARTARTRDFTPFPPGDVAVAEYPSYLTVKPTLCLLVLITGANEGDQFDATVQYQLVEKVLGQVNWPSS